MERPTRLDRQGEPTSRERMAPYALFVWAALGMLAGGGTLQHFLPLQWGLLITEFVVVLGLAALARWFFGMVDLGTTWRSLRTWDLSWSSLALLVVTAPVLGIFANLVAALGPELIPALQPIAEQYRQMTTDLFPSDDPLLFAAGVLSVVVAAPFCEEFLFRGTIQPLQERAHRSASIIVVLNGILFGAIHFNPLSFVALSIVGAFLADVTLRTRSLWPAVIGHAVLNLCNGLVLPTIAGDYADPAKQATLTEIGIALAIFTPITILLWRATRRSMEAQ